MSLINVNGITKRYRMGENRVIGVSNVTTQVEEGEFTALVGPSGSGKTTLLNLIGCLDKPDEGTISLNGRELTKLSGSELAGERLKHIGFVFQDYNLIPTLSALENVEFTLWLQGVSSAERRKRATAVLERVGLGSLTTRRPFALSRGQQQRVAVSRAIVHRPKVVLGDELTANLDHKTGSELMEFLRELNETDGITFLYATHDPAMMTYARRTLQLADGMLKSDP